MTKFCCPECFADRHLRRELFPFFSDREGQCSYCKSQNQLLVEPPKLKNEFEIVLGTYSENDLGKPLITLLQEEWLLFPLLTIDQAQALLVEIMEDSSFVGKLYIPTPLNKPNGLMRWATLRHELMCQNRFFPKSDFDNEEFEGLIANLLLTGDELPQQWYRARSQIEEVMFLPAEMGAPPSKLASQGRANPAGIPYLYIASSSNTAVSEIRPQTGAFVSVAEFTLRPDSVFIDLRNPRLTVSPFVFGSEFSISTLRGEIEFLENLGQELTRPVLLHDAAINYIPSQFLCEFIKNSGYSGVVYKSSVSEGFNVALFDPTLAIIGNVNRLKVTRVVVEAN